MTQEKLEEFVVLFTKTAQKLEDYQRWYEESIKENHILRTQLESAKKENANLQAKISELDNELELRILQVENLQDDISTLRFDIATSKGVDNEQH
jgi:chromosome segregation ATPase